MEGSLHHAFPLRHRGRGRAQGTHLRRRRDRGADARRVGNPHRETFHHQTRLPFLRRFGGRQKIPARGDGPPEPSRTAHHRFARPRAHLPRCRLRRRPEAGGCEPRPTQNLLQRKTRRVGDLHGRAAVQAGGARSAGPHVRAQYELGRLLRTLQPGIFPAQRRPLAHQQIRRRPVDGRHHPAREVEQSPE